MKKITTKKNRYNNDRLLNEELSVFTDKILQGSVEENENLSTKDPELRALQKTVLRLKNASPGDGPSDEAIQRMRQNVIKQWEKQEKKASKSFWTKLLSPQQSPEKNWQSQRSRRRLQLAVYITAAVFLLLINSPAMNKVTSGQPAASGQSMIYSAAIILGGFIVLVVWSYIRKS